MGFLLVWITFESIWGFRKIQNPRRLTKVAAILFQLSTTSSSHHMDLKGASLGVLYTLHWFHCHNFTVKPGQAFRNPLLK